MIHRSRHIRSMQVKQIATKYRACRKNSSIERHCAAAIVRSGICTSRQSNRVTWEGRLRQSDGLKIDTLSKPQTIIVSSSPSTARAARGIQFLSRRWHPDLSSFSRLTCPWYHVSATLPVLSLAHHPRCHWNWTFTHQLYAWKSVRSPASKRRFSSPFFFF